MAHRCSCRAIAITTGEIQTHIARLLGEVKIRALVIGNMYKDVSQFRAWIHPAILTKLQEAIRLIESAENAIQSAPTTLPIDERTLVPEPGKYKLQKRVINRILRLLLRNRPHMANSCSQPERAQLCSYL